MINYIEQGTQIKQQRQFLNLEIEGVFCLKCPVISIYVEKMKYFKNQFAVFTSFLNLPK